MVFIVTVVNIVIIYLINNLNNLSQLTDQWKMLYRRPKLIPSGYTHEVTGPWVDNEYYTNESLSDYGKALPDGGSWTILKNRLTHFWEVLDISKVCLNI